MTTQEALDRAKRWHACDDFADSQDGNTQNLCQACGKTEAAHVIAVLAKALRDKGRSEGPEFIAQLMDLGQ